MIKTPQNLMEEETLDPENWEELIALGHTMLDDMMAFLKDVRRHKVQPISEEVLARIQEPLPLKPQGYEQVYKEFLENIFPYPVPGIHPYFWGFVMGTGSPLGVLAEMLAAGMNSSGPGYFSPFHIEKQVLQWLKEIMNYPSEASGVLVSGGSMANFTGLAVARNAKAQVDTKKQGLQGIEQKMVLYASKEAHKCLSRSVELLGLGNDSFRHIPVNERFQIEVEALEDAIRHDKEAGLHPFCVVGNAGSVNTGAFDDFEALADLCQHENLWLHVDGAFGAWAKLSSTHSHLVRGMERADSLAFDLHKWMYMPYEIGCTLVRDKEAHCKAFIYEAEYLETISERHDPTNYSVQLSRNFKALKSWMLLKADGVEKYARLIQQNIDQALYLAERVKNTPHLELVIPVSLNVVCFRYVAERLGEETLKELNKQILLRLWLSGIIPSDTTLNGKYTLRACITNHRSKIKDFDHLVDEVIRIGSSLTQSS
jgi:glutamate/tyrosine decarboxylase-like PLP-dependent enzyme